MVGTLPYPIALVRTIFEIPNSFTVGLDPTRARLGISNDASKGDEIGPNFWCEQVFICNVLQCTLHTYNVQCMLNSFFTELSGMCIFLRIAPLFLEIGFSTEKSVDLHGRLRDS